MLTQARGFQRQLTAAELHQVASALRNVAERYDREGVTFTSEKRYSLLNQLMFQAHTGVSPRQLALGRTDNQHAMQNVSVRLSNGSDAPSINFELIENELTTSTDPAAGDPLVQNPLANPTFGASGGIIPPYWLDMMIRPLSRYLQAKNFAKIVPMSAPVDMAPLKTSKAEDWLSSIVPVAEGRAGQDVRTAYSLWKFDAYKYMFHSGLSWEVVKATLGKIELEMDLVNDLAEAYDLLIDQDYFESQYSAITLGKIRRYNLSGTAWAHNADIAQGAAYALTTNAPKHVLWYSTLDKKVYVPSTTTGNENKFQAATLHPDAPENLELWDVLPWLAKLMKAKRARMQYVNMHQDLSPLLTTDTRFTNTLYKTGNLVFESENGYLGRVPLGGTSSGTDVWELPQGILDGKETADTTPAAIYPVFGGQYGRSGLIGPWIPFNLSMDKGFEVVEVDSVDVLRPNQTDVFTVSGSQAVAPWDVDGLVLLKVVKVAKTA